MNEINTTTNLWIAVAKNGWILHHGNPNPNLDYHLTDLRLSYGRLLVYGTRRWEIMEDIKRWNEQCVNKKQFKCKAVKIAVAIKEIKKGEKQ